MICNHYLKSYNNNDFKLVDCAYLLNCLKILNNMPNLVVF